MFMQNFIKLSAPLMSCRANNKKEKKKLGDNAENNAAVASGGSNESRTCRPTTVSGSLPRPASCSHTLAASAVLRFCLTFVFIGRDLIVT